METKEIVWLGMGHEKLGVEALGAMQAMRG